MDNITWTSRNGYGSCRERFPAVCAKCGKRCEVPFRPQEGRDVFCRDCYEK